MAGIYLHIPFCQRRCIYCDFFSTTRSGEKPRYVRALCRELELRKDYLQGEEVETIYIGGGTPSQLTPDELAEIFDHIYRIYKVRANAEITLEANPDDLTDAYVLGLCRLPVNRLSMGIQTFHEETLQLLRRRHTARQAIDAFHRLREAGFQNLSIDLMYGLPGEDMARWEADLRQAVILRPEHLSAYHLIYEEGTALWQLREQHRVAEAPEELSLKMFGMLIDTLTAAGYEHYEISNFCLPGLHSRHNSSYWTGKRYLGCGPSAHSYDGLSRQWNPSSLDDYLRGIESSQPLFEVEEQDLYTRYNDFIITRLRTSWGLPLSHLQREFGDTLYRYCLRMARPHLERGTLTEADCTLRLSRQGIFISDGIMSDLLWVD